MCDYMSNPTYFFTRSSSTSRDPLDGKFAAASADALAEKATPLAGLGGLYWFVEVPGYDDRRAARRGMHVMSTEEIGLVMDQGYNAKAISGPFRAREEAERSFEDYWETLLGDYDD